MASSQVKSEVQHTSVTPAPVSLPVASGGTVPNIANVNRGHGVNNAAQFPGQFYYPNVNGPSPSVMQGAGSPHHQGIPSPHNSSGGQSPAHFVPVTATGHPQTFPIGMDNSFVPQQIANGSLAQHQQQMNFGQAQMQMDPAFANFQSFNGHMHAGSQHSSPEGVHQSASMPLSGNGRPQQPKRYRCPHPGCEKAFARNYNLGTHMVRSFFYSAVAV
ncbi:hypothetical protein BT69DRAFT_801396 [Atractiella rhizophila]|nr:hypothetical protein BT69DRAFT_801396 [Atractiella rhizophila]